jgi:hypothetical protein
MDVKEKAGEPDLLTATDAEIASAAKRLGVNGEHSASPAPKSRSGQVVQRLAHGRSHAVTVEIKAPRRNKS